MTERITGQPLDLVLGEQGFEPLGLAETGFNPRSWRSNPRGGLLARKSVPANLGQASGPLSAPLSADDSDLAPVLLARIAPTEIDTAFRMTHLHGQVHDENAFAIGGVAGHAGLFSSARDLARFAQMLLNGGSYGATRIVDPQTISYFTARIPGGSSRALGWDTPTENSSAGDYFSAQSFGHTGFTGTSIWIDPERDLFVILLTNRVNPTRANQRHIALRRAVHDAAQQAIVDMTVTKR
jgi:CubicO group peptidase (beta-lactamase class C family)